jgi:hypothetical protein
MMRGKEIWAIFIVIAAGAGILVFVASRTVGQVLSLQNNNSADSSFLAPANDSEWGTYQDPNFNFSFRYPPDWQIIPSNFTDATPFVTAAAPSAGTGEYELQVFIENNPGELSSGDFVHQMLAADHAQDAVNAKKGPAPQAAPQFDKSFIVDIGSYQAYELSDVFEFDHTAEQVYVARGNIVLRFDFPAAQENPNIALPVANNAIAHEMVATLQFGN